jgi:hypothetical protein
MAGEVVVDRLVTEVTADASGLLRTYQDAKQEAAAFKRTLEAPVNLKTYTSLEAELKRLQDSAQATRTKLLQVTPGSAEAQKLEAELGDVQHRLQLVAQSADHAKQRLQAMASFRPTGMAGGVARLNGAIDQGQMAYQQGFGQVGQMASGAGTGMMVGGVGLLMAGKYFTDAAAAAVEAESLFEVTFAENAAAARTWSDSLAEDYKRNAYALRGYAGSFAAVLKPSLGLENATAMSETLTKLAYDIESFRNIPIGDVQQKLMSGISGELEPMRALGVDLSQTALKAAAAAHGIAGFSEASDEATKRIVRYYAILDQTVDAQGDVARTMDSPTNKARAQKEQWEQLRVELGKELIPVYDRLLDTTGKAIKFITGLTDAQKHTLVSVLEWAAGILIVGGGLVKLGVFAAQAAFFIRALRLARLEDAAAAEVEAAATAQVTGAQVANRGAASGLMGALGRLHPVLIAITLAVAAGAVAWALYKAKQEEAGKKLRGTAELAQQQSKHFDSLVATLARVGAEYDTLSGQENTTAVDTEKLAQTKEHLSESIDAVARMMGLEGDAAKYSTDKYKDLLKVAKEYTKLRYDAAVSSKAAEVSDLQGEVGQAYNAVYAKARDAVYTKEYGGGWQAGKIRPGKKRSEAEVNADISQIIGDDPHYRAALDKLHLAKAELRDLRKYGMPKDADDATVTPSAAQDTQVARRMPQDFSDLDLYGAQLDTARKVRQAEEELQRLLRARAFLNPFDREAKARHDAEVALKEQEISNLQERGEAEAEWIQKNAASAREVQAGVLKAQQALDKAKLSGDKADIAAMQEVLDLAEEAAQRQQREDNAHMTQAMANWDEVHRKKLDDIREEADAKEAAIRREKELYDRFKQSAETFASLWLFQNKEMSRGIELAYTSPYAREQMARTGTGTAFPVPLHPGIPALPAGPSRGGSGLTQQARVMLEIGMDGSLSLLGVVGNMVNAALTQRARGIRTGG